MPPYPFGFLAKRQLTRGLARRHILRRLQIEALLKRDQEALRRTIAAFLAARKDTVLGAQGKVMDGLYISRTGELEVSASDARRPDAERAI